MFEIADTSPDQMDAQAAALAYWATAVKAVYIFATTYHL